MLAIASLGLEGPVPWNLLPGIAGGVAILASVSQESLTLKAAADTAR
jgi:hypothetical protein